MKIGIIFYSHTGNTYTVIKRLEKELLQEGHEVNIERLEPMDKDEVNPGAKNIKYKNLPDLDKYEGYIFGSPVQAFSLCNGMKSYLKQIESLENKKTFCFVTKGLPFNWTGGTRAIKQFKNLLEAKRADILEEGIVKWSSNKENDIDKLVNKVKRIF